MDDVEPHRAAEPASAGRSAGLDVWGLQSDAAAAGEALDAVGEPSDEAGRAVALAAAWLCPSAKRQREIAAELEQQTADARRRARQALGVE